MFGSSALKKLSFALSGPSYGLTRTNITAFNDASKFLFQDIQFRSVSGPNALNGIVTSTITPTITYNTVDNPINPRSGKSSFYSMGFTAAPLGGTVKTIITLSDSTHFYPLHKRR